MKKLTNYLIFVVCLFATHQASAVPACPYPIQYKQPDGTVITITLKGDERVHWATTFDGFTILVNKEGFYEYALKDMSGDLLLSSIRVHNANERTSQEDDFLKTAKKDLRYSRTQIHLLRQIWETKEKPSSADNAYSPAIGTVRAPLILVAFPGKPFRKTKNDFDLLMNQPNYTANGTITGSVRDYFYDNSYGQLTYQVDVFGPYTLSQPIGYYDFSIGGDPTVMAYEAAIQAHADGCNFANYDRDNDGIVDGLHIIFAGYGQEAGAPEGQSIWSHSSELELQLDGKQFSRYSCSPELRGVSGSNITYIGVIAHELSHVFGILDFYDTDYEQQGQSIDTGTWDIMARGSWNDNGRTPANHNAWSKAFLGWVPAVELTSESDITLPNPTVEGAVYKIKTTTPNEYFLIENRQKQGWDAYIPSNGMLIYHVDENYFGWSWNSNCINCVPSHRGMYIKQAGGGINSDNPNSTTDPYPSGGNTTFTDTSIPNSKSWVGTNTNKPITEITRNTTNRTVSFSFMKTPDYYDAALIRFINLPSGNFETIEAEIKVELENLGKPFADATITWSINGLAQITCNRTDSLTYGKKEIVTLGVATLTPGDIISATVTVADDVNESNNTISATIEIIEPKTLPYTTEFNGSLDGWESESIVGGLDWLWSDASNYYDNMAVTMLTRENGYALFGLIPEEHYLGPNPARAALLSPPFDFSNENENIELSFDYNVMCYMAPTTLKVQASTDNFQNHIIDLWTKYVSVFWDEAPEEPVINLATIAGESNVRIRFLYDGGEGFAWMIDNVKIRKANRDDFATVLLDTQSLPLTFAQSPNYPWKAEEDFVRNGNRYINNTDSYFSTTVASNEGLEVSFEWAISGNRIFEEEYFYFWVNNVPIISHSSKEPTGFTPLSFRLPPGSYTLKWQCEKYYPNPQNEDIAKIRNLKIIQKAYNSNFIIDKDSVLIAYLGTERHIVIPDSVKHIGKRVFFLKNIESVLLPDGLISIGQESFEWCNISSISIPNSVTTIGKDAFFQCTSLYSVFIPKSVTNIGSGAFAWCDKLNLIEVDNDNPAYCSLDGVLYSKDQALLLCYPMAKEGNSYVISNLVTKIDDYAFFDASLTSVVLPDGLISIGNSAFERCHLLSSIAIPKSVTSIGLYALGSCYQLKKVEVYWETPLDINFLGIYIHATEYVLFYNVFDWINLTAAKLIVPKGTRNLYKNEYIWRNFGSIDELVLALNNIVPSNLIVILKEGNLTVDSPVSEIVSIYSLNGVLLFQGKKQSGNEVFPIGQIQSQVLIVSGSSGWGKKIVK